MSTVGEKLVESWLDSQSERRYQNGFIQLLVAEGWSVLHNTRHSPIEFGKDVIARAPNGILHAIQLKGNPGSRLTKSQAQGMLSQVGELVDLPLPDNFKAKPDEKHVAVIVTNGEVDEEARLLFETYGKRTASPLSPCKELRIWSRGELLARFRDRLASVWPTSLEGIRSILEVYSLEGSELPSPQTLSKILQSVVPEANTASGEADLKARLTSALLLGELLKYPWINSKNHYACYAINVLVSMFLSPYGTSSERLSLLRGYDEVALGHAADLLNEAEESGFEPGNVWLRGDPLADIDIARERLRLIAECGAALLLSQTTAVIYSKDYALRCIRESFGANTLWGHAVVPSKIIRYMAWRNNDATQAPEQVLFALIRAIPLVASKVTTGLPAPYYGFEECLFLHSSGTFGEKSQIADDNTKGRVWFVTAIMYLLAKRNWKQTCKAVWSSISKLQHEEFELDPMKFSDPGLTKRGRLVTRQYYASTWRDFVERAVGAGDRALTTGYDGRAWLVAAYVAIVPYRAWTDVLLWLDDHLCDTWFNKQHPTPAS